MAEAKKQEVIKAGIDLIDLTQGKAWIKAQIDKRKKSIDYFIEKEKKLKEVLKKAGR